MPFSLNHLRPSFRRAHEQGELITNINRALDTGRVDAASFGVQQLIAGYGDNAQTASAVVAIIDRAERGVASEKYVAGQYADKLSLQYDRAVVAQKKWDESAMGSLLSSSRPYPESQATPAERIRGAAAAALRTLAEHDGKNKKIVPVVQAVLDRIAVQGGEQAMDTADFIAQAASPKWLGFMVGEDHALTNRHKAFEPLKKVALNELLAIAGRAEAGGDLRLAFHAASQAEYDSADARAFHDLHLAAREKRMALQQKGNFSPPHYRHNP